MDSAQAWKTAYVFISYAHEEVSTYFVRSLRDHLHKTGIRTWQDINDIRVGQLWSVEIDRAIGESLAVIAVFTPAAAASQYVTYEWSYALGLGKPILPIWLSGDDSLHKGVSGRFQAIDMRGRRGDNEIDAKFDELIKRIQGIGAQQAAFEEAQAGLSSSQIVVDALDALMRETTSGTPDVSAVINRFRTAGVISNEQQFMLHKTWRELRQRNRSLT